jgi:CBS domain-containing protein
MSSPLITISSTSSPSEAADMMLQHNVRHLLVVDNSGNNHNGDAIDLLAWLPHLTLQYIKEISALQIKTQLKRY